MAGQRIEQVCRFVQKVCDTERHGGKCFVINDSSCVLHDYDEWNSEMHDKVKTRFPDTSIVCTHNPSSATSFSVIFTLESRSSRLLLLLVMIGVWVMTGMGSWRLVSGPWLACGVLGWERNLMQCGGETH